MTAGMWRKLEHRTVTNSNFQHCILRKHSFAISPHIFARGLFKSSARFEKRARGMPGAQCTRSLVRAEIVKYAHQYSQRGTGIIRHSRARMVLTLIARSPRRRIRLASVVSELTAYLSPVGPARLRQLDTSNGCQDHTPSRSHQCRSSRTPLLTTHEFRSPCDLRRARHRRVHRIPPNVRDDRETPLCLGGMARSKTPISEKQKRNIFSVGTGQAKSR
jgi:hypothetical protein